MNILVLSAGTRNKIIQYLVRELEGRGIVVAADMSPLAPALYEADRHYLIPALKDSCYLENVLEICRKEKIRGIISLIDPELSLLAKNKVLFEELGATIIGSSYELCQMSLDKYQMYQWLVKHNYHCARTWIRQESFLTEVRAGTATFPVFVKPICGSASISICKVFNEETLQVLFSNEQDLMIQEYLEGQEIGADVYIDMLNGKVVSIFTKKKLKMRAGETDKAVSFKDEKLFHLIKKFSEEAGYRGQIDIDLFDINGKYYISEVNPRFGGGYPHAYEAGCNHMKMILNNLEGKVNLDTIGSYKENLFMMKYNEVRIL